MRVEFGNLLASPDFQAFLGFLKEQSDTLNRVDDISGTPDEVALETMARKRAIETLKKILSVVEEPTTKPFNLKEFVS